MPSAFLGLVDAAVAALTQAPAVLTATRVRRGRDLPVPAEWPSAIDVHLRSSRGDAASLTAPSLTRWQTDVGVDIRVRAQAAQAGDAAVDALLEAVFARFATVAPPAGVFSWVLQPALTWDFDEADRTLVHAALLLRVDHFTSGGGLAPAS